MRGGAGKARRKLSAARISRRSCARTCHLRHAVPRLSQCRRGRIVAPARRSGAQGNLRRGRAHASISAQRSSSADRKSMPAAGSATAILADVCEALIGAVFLDGGYRGARPWSSGCGMSACARRRVRCAIPRPCCRNGRRRAACRRRPIAKSPAPARITIRNSASPSSCRISCPPKAWAARSAPPNRPPPPPCCPARAWKRSARWLSRHPGERSATPRAAASSR